MSCDLFIPLYSFVVCAEALTRSGRSIAYQLIYLKLKLYRIHSWPDPALKPLPLPGR